MELIGLLNTACFALATGYYCLSGLFTLIVVANYSWFLLTALVELNWSAVVAAVATKAPT